ncbi:hypothetical protein D9M68_841480 [compost metagenome]
MLQINKNNSLYREGKTVHEDMAGNAGNGIALVGYTCIRKMVKYKVTKGIAAFNPHAMVRPFSSIQGD